MKPLLRKFGDLSVVEGVLVNPATAADLAEAQKLWPPILRNVASEFIAQGSASEVKIWQGHWGSKIAQLADKAASIQAIKAKGRVEGLIKLLVDGQTSRLAKGELLVYVDLVEAAPWNVRRYMNVVGRDPVYKDVGIELMRLAIKESLNRGFAGRVGLHAIPRAEAFYRAIGMNDLGPDPAKGNMRYFEFEDTKAQKIDGERA